MNKPAYQTDMTTLASDFECSACSQMICGIIYSCKAGGHLVCEICKPKCNDVCAICKQPIDCRLRHSENLRNNTRFLCHCSQEIIGNDFATHISTCTALPKDCPCCHFPVPLNEMEAHLNKHDVSVLDFKEQNTFFTAGKAPYVFRTGYEKEELNGYEYNSHVPGLGHLWVAKCASLPQIFKYDVSCELHLDQMQMEGYKRVLQFHISKTPLFVQVNGASKQIVISLIYKENKKYQFELYRQDGSLFTHFVVPVNGDVLPICDFKYLNESVLKMTIRCATLCVDSISSSES